MMKLLSSCFVGVLLLTKETTPHISKDHFVVGEQSIFLRTYKMTNACEMGRMPRSPNRIILAILLLLCLVTNKRKRLSHTNTRTISKKIA